MPQLAANLTVTEAHLMHAFLQANGIDASIRDETTVRTYWALSNAIGGVKIDVSDIDIQVARELLNSYYTAQKSDVAETSPNRKKPTLARYLKIAIILFLSILTVLVFAIGSSGDGYLPNIGLVIMSLLLTGATTLFLAIFDL